MIRYHCLQHVPFESPGNIETWIKENGDSLSFTHLYEHAEFPSMNDFDILIIMGGPMSVHDEKEFGWLKKEKEFISKAIKENKKIIGICLGAQLIADVLGAKVFQNKEKEIGFMPVYFTDAAFQNKIFKNFHKEETVFHWHGETFDLPESANLLASSAACKNQAFMIGENIIGLQFHLEVTPKIVEEMIKHEGHELVQSNYIHSAEKIKSELGYLDRNREILFEMMSKF